MNITDKKKAFTLIELLIVVMIVLLFSGLLLTQYGNFIEQTRLKTEANKLKDILELAKKKATAKEIIGTCISGFNGYQVNMTSSGYILSFCCGGVCSEDDFVHSFNLTSLTNNISIVSGNGPIQFNRSSQGTSLINDTTIILKNSAISNASKCIEINVSKIGIIGVSDTFTSCP